ncbi:long-chain acyl-CoA synthetase [Paenibacillus shirakamiensis]|uniref:Long-chain acyl-CoA synthetase n=1 Tax=Paenibacillus shirakamiensis TaxID=1265935 RepID=A0ABS4JDB8_9BACL|nr:AMP-binding protein [Paenibacillus shirakamiensis]MBP1999075.1 long-chain acyl-CoA synthetase [Paenibacillus shirakamiensis]
MPNKPWMNQYPQEVPHSYDYPKMNLANILVDSALAYPNHTALDFMGKKISYRELLKSAYRFANALLKLGIRKGDRIAVMLPNCPQGVIAYYGTLLAGGIAVMTNPLYVPREIEHQLTDAGVRMIVTLDALVGRVTKAMENHPLEYTLVTGVQDYLPFPKNVLYPLKAKKDGTAAVPVKYSNHVLSFKKLLESSSDAPVHVEVNPEEDLALIQYTGGTTGFAKGVMLTHMNLVSNAIQANLWFYKCEKGKEKYLAALPFFHVFGLTVLLNLAIYTAGTLILMPRFEIKQVLKAIDKQRPSIFPGAPTMYIAIINNAEVVKYDLSSIETCISGAAPLPVEVQEKFERLTGGRLIEGYGLTEASPVTHVNNIWGRRKPASIGLPFPDTEARIVNGLTGEDLPLGEIGELIVRGPQVMKGYWKRPEDTAATLRDGWLYTGDLARMDEEGFFFILDRRKDLIIAGGYNIYPREVEEVLFEHPDVAEAVVAGIVDPYRGESVKAYIVLKDGCETTEAELKSFCKERLAVYKVPKVYEFREALPKTLVGKVLRRKLIDEEADTFNKSV